MPGEKVSQEGEKLVSRFLACICRVLRWVWRQLAAWTRPARDRLLELVGGRPASRLVWQTAFVGVALTAAGIKAAQLEWWPGNDTVPVQEVVRQVAVLLLVLGFAAVAPRRPKTLEPATAVRALGVAPTWPRSTRSNGQLARLALGLLAMGLTVAACLRPIDGVTRVLALGGGLASVVALIGWELARSSSVQRPRPDRAVLWTVAPLTAAAGVTAVILVAHSWHSHLSGGELTNLVLVTALGEELIFRGVLLATAYRLFTSFWAEVLTAALFGIWHVGNLLQKSVEPTVLAVLGAIAINIGGPAVGGVIFSVLRHRSRSLAGSVGGHVSTNLVGLALERSVAKAVF